MVVFARTGRYLSAPRPARQRVSPFAVFSGRFARFRINEMHRSTCQGGGIQPSWLGNPRWAVIETDQARFRKKPAPTDAGKQHEI